MSLSFKNVKNEFQIFIINILKYSSWNPHIFMRIIIRNNNPLLEICLIGKKI